ncbi:hypothetical protein B1R94_02095 [Mycolicibacterium litorale]|nr:hypothetical protein B1R94_02095 [Mycolicibacterium litorale]
MREIHSPDSMGDVGELMRAIYATHPNLSVAIKLNRHSDSDYASVEVLGLPGHFADLDEERDGEYIWTSMTPGRYGIHLNGFRVDGDLAAMLATALAFITARSTAVAS